MKEKLIGYQVIDSDGNYPDDMYSFQVFSLKNCLAVQRTDNKRWRLLPIYEGDIEEPTIEEAVSGYRENTDASLKETYREICNQPNQIKNF